MLRISCVTGDADEAAALLTFLEPLGLSEVLRFRKSPRSLRFASLMIAGKDHDRMLDFVGRNDVVVVRVSAHVRPRLSEAEFEVRCLTRTKYLELPRAG